jgi:signal transduction histidine kinase
LNTNLIAFLVVSVLGNALPLVGVLFVLLGLFSLTYTKRPQKKYLIFNHQVTNQSIRDFLGFLFLFLLVVIIYWLTDTFIRDLPDPVVLYTLFILLIVINFGIIVGSMVAVLSFLLVDFYLFEPRYHLIATQDASSILSTLIGIVVTLYVGTKIHDYQQGLIKKTGDLEMLIKARDQFAAIAAHDLKNPITTIKLYTDLLGHKKISVKANSAINQSTSVIDRETDKLLIMIDSLLDFSKLQNQKLELKIQTLDLVSILKFRIEVLSKLFPDHNFTFKSTFKKALVLADSIAMERILTNLLTNAAKYSPPKTQILVEINKDKNEFIISIKDQGRGIPAQLQQKLFEPFFQSSKNNQGLGLGLYIVKALVEMQNGQIWLNSTLKRGSTFYLSFPAYLS